MLSRLLQIMTSFNLDLQQGGHQKKNMKIAIPRPTFLKLTILEWGGVDLLDQQLAVYRTRMRQKQWWWPIFSYVPDVTVVNSWRLMQKICSQY